MLGFGAISSRALMTLPADLASVPHGVVRIRRRARVWREVPPELQPAVNLAEGYADAIAVERAVDEALRRYRAISERMSLARRNALVDQLQEAILAAVEAASERDDEDALLALM